MRFTGVAMRNTVASDTNFEDLTSLLQIAKLSIVVWRIGTCCRSATRQRLKVEIWTWISTHVFPNRIRNKQSSVYNHFRSAWKAKPSYIAFRKYFLERWCQCEKPKPTMLEWTKASSRIIVRHKPTIKYLTLFIFALSLQKLCLSHVGAYCCLKYVCGMRWKKRARRELTLCKIIIVSFLTKDLIILHLFSKN